MGQLRRLTAEESITDPISAMVLAGGKSRRLGFDKALVTLDSEQNLMASAVATLKRVSSDVMVVGSDDTRQGVDARVVTDVFPGKGSLGGMYSGLLRAEYHHCLVVACDMPFVNVDLLAYMVSCPRDYDVLIPRIGDVLEPLHAIYSKDCLPYMRELLVRDHLKIIDFFDEVRVRYLEADDIDRFDPEHLSFFNVNTPEQLARAKRIADSRMSREG